MLPEPSSNLIGLRFFVLMRQLLRLRVSPFYQVNIPLGRFHASPRFLLKGVQNINSLANLNRQNHTVGVRRVSQRNLKDAASYALERLRVFRHAAELNELEFVSKQFLRTLREIPNVLFRASQPNHRSRRGRPEVLQERTSTIYSKSTIMSKARKRPPFVIL